METETQPYKVGKGWKIAGVVFVIFFVLVGIGAWTEDPAPETTTTTTEKVTTTTEAPTTTEKVTTTTVAPTTTQAPVTAPPTTQPSMSQDEINALALEMTWDDLSQSDKTDICLYYSIDPDGALDSFFSGSGYGTFTYDQVNDFFYSKCIEGDWS